MTVHFESCDLFLFSATRYFGRRVNDLSLGLEVSESESQEAVLEAMMFKKWKNELYGSVCNVLGYGRIIQYIIIEQLLCAKLCNKPSGYSSEQQQQNTCFHGIYILVLGSGWGTENKQT